ncbi:MAG: ATP phosphoribosyltransferase [Spirochaeta sp. LUC14_002_19_P3]|nr:MAG: ATP phosphoribosyltransferase [Spirochaeta sp. LUC14_002_19_P3]
MKALTLAVPKGRLFDAVSAYLAEKGLSVRFENRQLSAVDASGRLEIYQVKNKDLPTYVHHGIAGLGIVGDDTIAESGLSFVQVATLPLGATRLCLAAPKGTALPMGRSAAVATSYVRQTRQWFHQRGIPVKIIRLAGSVELAPALGLADYIIDLVETGSTLAANGLEIITTMKDIKVRLIANPAYFKLNYGAIEELAHTLGYL